MIIRDEHPEDVDNIHDLTAAAFKPMVFSDNTEAAAIRTLRADGDLVISLVAEDEDNHEIVGHIAFSPVTIDNVHNGWFGLGPISVKPERQRQGIGKSLISEGLKKLRKQGASGCVLIGNPDIYKRAGFESDGLLTYRDLESRFVQRIVFKDAPPSGRLKFARGLENS